MICTLYLELRITISKYHSRYLYQISLATNHAITYTNMDTGQYAQQTGAFSSPEIHRQNTCRWCFSDSPPLYGFPDNMETMVCPLGVCIASAFWTSLQYFRYENRHSKTKWRSCIFLDLLVISAICLKNAKPCSFTKWVQLRWRDFLNTVNSLLIKHSWCMTR